MQGYLVKDLDVSIGFITKDVNDLTWLCERTLGKTVDYNPYVIGKWNAEKY